MKSLLVLALVCVFAAYANAVALDAACSKDSECTTTTDNSECKKEFSSCDKGECECKTGYREVGSVCKPLKKKGASCDTTTDVCEETGTTCTSSTCQCSTGLTWNDLVDKCITTNLKAVTQTCSADGDCYNSMAVDAVECDSSTSKCKCKAGYIQEKYECRKPNYGETCTSGVGCVSSISVGAQTEECDSTTNKCKCPTSSTKVSKTYMSKTYHLCYTDYTSKKKLGADCTSNHECSSYWCSACPGVTQKKCVELANSAVMTSSFGILTLLSVAILFM